MLQKRTSDVVNWRVVPQSVPQVFYPGFVAFWCSVWAHTHTHTYKHMKSNNDADDDKATTGQPKEKLCKTIDKMWEEDPLSSAGSGWSSLSPMPRLSSSSFWVQMSFTSVFSCVGIWGLPPVPVHDAVLLRDGFLLPTSKIIAIVFANWFSYL